MGRTGALTPGCALTWRCQAGLALEDWGAASVGFGSRVPPAHQPLVSR